MTWEPLENFFDRTVVNKYISDKAKALLSQDKAAEDKAKKKQAEESDENVQTADENIALEKTTTHSYDGVMIGLAKVAAENGGELTAKQLLERLMTSQKKPLSVKTTGKGLTRAFAALTEYGKAALSKPAPETNAGGDDKEPERLRQMPATTNQRLRNLLATRRWR